MISPERFRAVLQRYPLSPDHTVVRFAGLGEPLLHRGLPHLVRIAGEAGLDCIVATNLQVDADFAELTRRPNLREIQVSMSGVRQEVYARAHAGARIDKLMRNLRTLSALKRELGARFDVCLHFHRYRYNAEDEAEARRLARELGFGFRSFLGLAQNQGRESLLRGWTSWRERTEILSRAYLRDGVAFKYDPLARRDRCPRFDDAAREVESSVLYFDADGALEGLCCWILGEHAPRYDFLHDRYDAIRRAAHRDYGKNEVCRACEASGAWHTLSYMTCYYYCLITVADEVLGTRRVDEVLRCDAETLAQRHRQAARRLVAERGGRLRVVLYGAGACGRSCLDNLPETVEVAAFIDDRVRETQLGGVPLLSMQEAVARHGQGAVFVAAVADEADAHRMAARLSASGVSRAYAGLAPFMREHLEWVLPHFR
jgi:MoaA/NifB/PqqE/SkfB family radical SAM enzyme